jgi:hypothetical protein
VYWFVHEIVTWVHKKPVEKKAGLSLKNLGAILGAALGVALAKSPSSASKETGGKANFGLNLASFGLHSTSQEDLRDGESSFWNPCFIHDATAPPFC